MRAQYRLLGMNRFEGRTALITGGASGIGAETAARLAAEGAKVAIADTNPDKGLAVAADLGGVFVQADVSDPAASKAAVEEVVGQIGPIDVLVNQIGCKPIVLFCDVFPGPSCR
jgi:NAD(P)-dependent dehydrogenase (short-subunit alcohol dehydrogenase family)